jgi:hypothetical protein
MEQYIILLLRYYTQERERERERERGLIKQYNTRINKEKKKE